MCLDPGIVFSNRGDDNHTVVPPVRWRIVDLHLVGWRLVVLHLVGWRIVVVLLVAPRAG